MRPALERYLMIIICSFSHNLFVKYEVPLVLCLDYENEYGPEYGEKWVMFIDDNGTSHIMNFSSLPADSRSLQYGDAYFHLYTRRNINNPETLEPKRNGVVSSDYFDRSKNVKVITHGWLSNDQTDWLQKMKNIFLEKYDLNVITVDWGELSNNPVYPWPALSTRYVGRRVADLLKALMRSYQITGGDVHLIGHSLGAQVMGYAGMFSEEKLFRITGLDPARPLFEIPLMPSDFRLEKNDAEFVDIIHTAGGVLGYRDSHGHADFYPNNGRPMQPGCGGTQQVIEACSHGRSYEYFAESIYSNVPFKAYPCESWDSFTRNECTQNANVMGYPTLLDQNGDFYLLTNNEPRYAIDD